MSNGLNKVMLIGNLGRDPELRFTQAGTAMLNMTLAVNESWMKDGEKQERTEWARIVMFGNRAEGVSKHLRKGSRIYLEGRLQTREWEDKEGNKRFTTEIVANELLFLDGRRSEDGTEREAREPKPKHREERYPAPDDTDDLPF